MSTATDLRWDLDSLFPGLDSAEYEAAVASLKGKLDALEGALGKGAELDELIEAYNVAQFEASNLGTYTYCHVSSDSSNARAQARLSELDPDFARLRKLSKSLAARVGDLDLGTELDSVASARDHEFALLKMKITSEHLMNPAEEALASDMELTGSVAWTKLYRNVTSRLEAEVEGEKMPISAVRALAYDPSRQKRRAAYEAELKAWPTVEIPLAAAMNSIKGETIALGERRGWPSPLDQALFNSNIDAATLEAMMTAAHESFPDFRRYLKAKARKLGVEKLAFYDLFAPVGEGGRVWAVEEAKSFVSKQFYTFSERMGGLAERSYDERWTDWEPRPGKVDGAYCAPAGRDGSRVLMNFKPSFGSVSTLAHELGHAYHNLCLGSRTPLQRGTPMTLAETASIFCETVIRQASLATMEGEEALGVLEASLQGSCQVVVDITSRYLFEKGVFEDRKARELTPEEMCAKMRDAQLATYGDGLDPEALHPYMWAAKGHYYGRAFYNFPYMFGLLFALGLYAVYLEEGEAFVPRYDELLSSTGLADAATLADKFGIDIRTPDFWRASLATIRGDIDRFESLVS
ncbi:oligoendopeptidase F [bacterium]|nr:MAG: oligoendopeptidase F [bacterium]